MHGIEKRLLVKRYLEGGVSKTATARVAGISRRTVYNWIQSGELERDPDDLVVQYGPRSPRPTILDAYKEMIDARLSDFPEVSAAKLFREIREAGYPGGYGQVKRYVRLKKDEVAEGERTAPTGRGPD